ncbi:hypothetical protein RvY_15259-1 [Ramazzottius varieornatus]|uniref:Uncharacterized protein n=1 Tax=Ramazzottius varieornatus TaxID=947166 RepID=A0A1D1VU90_RAMVA|nr:hypothetical protein RvY_15259-1 [Ramazzottius varieornatus]
MMGHMEKVWSTGEANLVELQAPPQPSRDSCREEGASNPNCIVHHCSCKLPTEDQAQSPRCADEERDCKMRRSIHPNASFPSEKVINNQSLILVSTSARRSDVARHLSQHSHFTHAAFTFRFRPESAIACSNLSEHQAHERT